MSKKKVGSARSVVVVDFVCFFFVVWFIDFRALSWHPHYFLRHPFYIEKNCAEQPEHQFAWFLHFYLLRGPKNTLRHSWAWYDTGISPWNYREWCWRWKVLSGSSIRNYDCIQFSRHFPQCAHFCRPTWSSETWKTKTWFKLISQSGSLEFPHNFGSLHFEYLIDCSMNDNILNRSVIEINGNYRSSLLSVCSSKVWFGWNCLQPGGSWCSTAWRGTLTFKLTSLALFVGRLNVILECGKKNIIDFV